MQELKGRLDENEKERRSLEKAIKDEQGQYIQLNQKYNELQKKLDKMNRNHVEVPEQDEESLIEQLEELQSKLQDMEQSQKVLRRIKHAFKQTLEVKCRGCSKIFKPVIFKAHVLSCQKLLEDPDSFQDIA